MILDIIRKGISAKASEIHVQELAYVAYMIDGVYKPDNSVESLNNASLEQMVKTISTLKGANSGLVNELEKNGYAETTVAMINTNLRIIAWKDTYGKLSIVVYIGELAIPAPEDIGIPPRFIEKFGEFSHGITTVSIIEKKGGYLQLYSLINNLIRTKRSRVCFHGITKKYEMAYNNFFAAYIDKDFDIDKVDTLGYSIVVIDQPKNSEDLKSIIDLAATGHHVIVAMREGTAYDCLSGLMGKSDGMRFLRYRLLDFYNGGLSTDVVYTSKGKRTIYETVVGSEAFRSTLITRENMNELNKSSYIAQISKDTDCQTFDSQTYKIAAGDF